MAHPTVVALDALLDLAGHDPAAAHTGLHRLLVDIDEATETARRTHARLTALAADLTGDQAADLRRVSDAVADDLVAFTTTMPKAWAALTRVRATAAARAAS